MASTSTQLWKHEPTQTQKGFDLINNRHLRSSEMEHSNSQLVKSVSMLLISLPRLFTKFVYYNSGSKEYIL